MWYATLDPRLETDPLDERDIIMYNDFLGASIIGGLEITQMSRMTKIPMPFERIGPALPQPPAPAGSPAAPAPNLLPLYYYCMSQSV